MALQKQKTKALQNFLLVVGIALTFSSPVKADNISLDCQAFAEDLKEFDNNNDKKNDNAEEEEMKIYHLDLYIKKKEGSYTDWLKKELGVDLSQKDDQYLKDLSQIILNCQNKVQDKTHLLEDYLQNASGMVVQVLMSRATDKEKVANKSEIDLMPPCDEPGVIENLTKMVANSPEGQSGLQLLHVSEVQDVTSYSEPKRECSAIGFFNTGKQQFQYHVEWMDKEKGQYWVQIDNQ